MLDISRTVNVKCTLAPRQLLSSVYRLLNSYCQVYTGTWTVTVKCTLTPGKFTLAPIQLLSVVHWLLDSAAVGLHCGPLKDAVNVP